MKRIISFCLALCVLLTTFAVQVLATGDELGSYGGSNGQVDDNLSEVGPVFDKQYAVAFNDFENITGGVSDYKFKFVDSGDVDYGKVFSVTAMTSSATPGTITATYPWNGATYTMFSEPLNIGEKYIISYDYYSVPTTANKKDYVFSFGPKHDAFKFYNGVGDDFRHWPKYYNDNAWHKDSVGFVATKDKTDIKLNSNACNINTYMDNYLVMQAVELHYTDSSGRLKMTAVDNNIVTTPVSDGATKNIHMVAKGDKLELAFEVPEILDLVVKVGDDEIQPNKDGHYVINKVTEDIYVETFVTNANLTNILKNSAVINQDNIYIPYGRTVYSLADDLYAVNSFINTKTLKGANASNTELKINNKLTIGDKVYSEYDGVKSDAFNVKFAGDANEDGIITVSDITSTVSLLVDGDGAEKFSGIYDFDGNGSVNVSDIVNIRSNILGNTCDTRNAEADLIAASGVDFDFVELDNGVYNVGDQSALANVIRKAMRGEEVIISCFGGSITAEGGAGDAIEASSGIVTTLNTDSYCDRLLHWFEDTFEKYGASFTLINAGIGATDTQNSIHRMYEDVVNAIPGKKPDLVVYEWACNDTKAASKGAFHKQGTYEYGIRRFIAEDIAVIMFDFDQVYHEGSQEWHEPISKFYDLPHFSYSDAYSELNEWQYLSKSTDRVHPNRIGHTLASLLMTRYLNGIYRNIDFVDEIVPEIPEDTYNDEASYYGDKVFTAKLTDIEAGNVEGVRIVDPGDFTRDTNGEYSFGNNAYAQYPNIVSCKRKYTGYTAKQNTTGEYAPLIIEADDIKTAFILIRRVSNLTDCKFNVEVNGVNVEDEFGSFNCSNVGASDHSQIESANHWATSRICYNENPDKVTIKITPNLGIYDGSSSQKEIRLFALLLSK